MELGHLPGMCEVAPFEPRAGPRGMRTVLGNAIEEAKDGEGVGSEALDIALGV